MKTYKAINGQSLPDICLNTYGSMDYFYKLLQDNNVTSADAMPYTGQTFTWDETLIVDALVSQQITLTNTKFATASSGNTNTYYIVQGVGQELSTSQQGQTITPIIPVNMYQKTSATDYTSTSVGGETAISLPALSGKDIVQVEKNIQPLKQIEWSWNKVTFTLTLSEPIFSGENLYIIYTEMITI